jgi:hypothetical protein
MGFGSVQRALPRYLKAKNEAFWEETFWALSVISKELSEELL